MVDFYGNIKLGQDVSLKDLLKAYSAVVLVRVFENYKLLRL